MSDIPGTEEEIIFSEPMIAVPKRTMESVLDLLAEIVHPVVLFSKDQREMALWVIEQNKAKAEEAIQLLSGEDDYEIEEEISYDRFQSEDNPTGGRR